MAKKFEAELGINNKGFVDGLQEAEGSVGRFGKQMAAITVALGAAGAAFGIIINWIKETAAGAEIMNTTLTVSKQLLTDIMMGQGLHLKEAWKNAQLQNKINEDNAVEVYKLAKLQKELNLLVVAASDQTKSLAEKKQILTKAMEKEHEIKQFLLEDAREEKKAAWDAWQINLANTKARENFYKAAARVEDVMGMDSRRLMSQYSGVMEQQTQRARDLADAFTEVAESIDDVNERLQNPINNASLGKAAMGNMKGLPGYEKPGMEGIQNAPGQAAEAIKEFSSMQEAIMNLSATFSTFFSDVNLGFQGMIDGIITGLKRLVMELIAKSAILAILGLITGIPLSGAMFTNLLFGGNIGSLIKGGAIGASSGAAAAPMSGAVEFVLKGKDLYGSVNRYSQELGFGT